MLLYISKETTGADFGLVLTETKFKKTHGTTQPEGALQVPSREYYKLRKLYNLPYHSFPPERFRRPFEAILKEKGGKLPWKKIIPHTIYQKELRSFVKGIQEDFKNTDLSYYFNVYKKENSLFRSFEDATIDIEIYNNLSKKGTNQSSEAILKTFMPVKQTHGTWKTAPVYYDRLSTLTGRLTISKGPNILLLKKEYRKCLTSQWGKDGNIYFIDYKSLEPRLLLAIKDPELQIPKDPYLYAAISMGVDGKIDRSHIKTAIISMIYGAGDKELVRQLKPYIPMPEEFIASVKEQFGVEGLKEKLKAEHEISKGKFIYNHYGRPIVANGKAPYVLVNYFIQSTAVDIALLGFTRIVNKLAESGASKLIHPLFVLHDALVLDVHNNVSNLLTKLSNLGSTKIPEFENIKFWLEIEKLK